MRRIGFVCGLALMAAAFSLTAHPVASGQTGAAGVKVVTEKTTGPISVKVGSTLEVKLEANHTTGYSWIAAPAVDPVLVSQGKAAYQEHPSGGKTGVGGVEIWRFKAVKAGKQSLQFEYRRPFEKTAPAAKTVLFSVVVE
jgi:inhibitor of cysteine peptidase